MHPIEQLRFVARASGADASLLVQEAASALSVFASDRPGLVTAARRLLTRQPAIGPLWWMCHRMVLSDDPRQEARSVIEDLRHDRTGRNLAHELPDGATVVIIGWPDTIVEALPRRGDVSVLVVDVEGQGPAAVRRLERSDVIAEDIAAEHLGGAVTEASLVLVEVAAAGPAAALTDVGSLAAAATARAVGTPTWMVAGVGRLLPEAYWQEVAERTTTTDEPAWMAAHEVVASGLIDRVVTADGVCHPDDAEPDTVGIAPELLRALT
ncbi:MAG: hypothetical protein ACK5PP_09200 [Acidimicrobiales bacterium]